MLKRLTYSFVSAILLSMLLVPVIHAESIVLDGVIDETGYELFIEDTTHAPIYSLYTAIDDDNLYLGLILEGDTDASNDKIEFAYRQDGVDFWIQVKGGVCKYRPSGGAWEGWWQGKRDGLPARARATVWKVDLAVGETGGWTSYEFCIPRSVLGKYGEDLPNSFRFWLEVMGDVGGVDYNNYPEDQDDWWFYKGDEEPSFNGGEEPAPEFHIPEVPYGTLLSLATMAAAFAVVSRKRIIR